MIGCVLKKVLLDEINFHRCIKQSIFVFAIKFMTYVYKSGLKLAERVTIFYLSNSISCLNSYHLSSEKGEMRYNVYL